VVGRRRRGDLRFAREDDEADPQALRRAIDERSQRLLGSAEASGLDVPGLHRARRVDDQDHDGALLGHHPVDVRARERDAQRRE
jgi:hypothetical protein